MPVCNLQLTIHPILRASTTKEGHTLANGEERRTTATDQHPHQTTTTTTTDLVITTTVAVLMGRTKPWKILVAKRPIGNATN